MDDLTPHPYRQHIFEQIFIVTSAFSASMSFFILLTCHLFPTFGSKYFIKIVYYMSLCDLFASTTAAIGFPTSGTSLCTFQSFWMWYFFRAYWLWTVLLSYQLYRLILHQPLLPMLYLHIISWGVALVGTLLPLTNGATYGMINRFSGNAWCFLDNCSRSELRFWVYLTLQTYVWISIALMIFFYVRAYWYYHYETGLNHEVYDSRQSEYHRILQQGIFQISLYPIALMISWGPTMIIFPLFTYGIVSLLSFDIALVMGTLNGVMAGSIFLIRSREVQVLWYQFLTTKICWCCCHDQVASQHLISTSTIPSSSGHLTSRSSTDVPQKEERERSSTWDPNRFLSFSRSTITTDRIESIEIPNFQRVNRVSIFAYEPNKEEIYRISEVDS